MPIIDLYSYRKKVAEGETPDVFIYDELPRHLRVQIIHIWRDAIGKYYVNSPYPVYSPCASHPQTQNNEAWEFIHKAFAKELGEFDLGIEPKVDSRCENYFLNCQSVEIALDLIELTFFYIHKIAREFSKSERAYHGIKITANDAITELNERFRRASVGYRFEDGKIFRINSELIHAEIVKPALRLLQNPGFEGPCEEFMSAYTHYRNGQSKDAITDANNAFESTLKAICDQRRWEYSQGSRSSDLLRVVKNSGLLPDYLDKSFDQLVATLKSGLPKVRNKESAHGQGAVPRETPDYVAAYALHLSAAKILFLIESHRAMD